MKINYNYIKVIGLLVLVVFLFAFSSIRNSARIVSEPNIKFLGDENLFITHDGVSKLLIQNEQSISNQPKETIDLNGLETDLNDNDMIKRAQVYINVNGTLTAEIEQKKPIARVSTEVSYYIDDEGSYMPLSTIYASRVPLVTGFVVKNELYNVFSIAKKVQSDDFLRKHVIEIHQNKDQSIDLKFRLNDFRIQLGSLNQLDKKINNLKAFYQKAMKDGTLNSFSVVNLRFDKQVICTKN